MHISKTFAINDFDAAKTIRRAARVGNAAAAEFASSPDTELFGICAAFDFVVRAQRQCWTAIAGDECEHYIDDLFCELSALKNSIIQAPPVTPEGCRAVARTIVHEHLESYSEDGLIDHDLLDPEMVAALLSALTVA